MASTIRTMKCAGCNEGKLKLTWTENGLYCTECIEQMNEEDIGIKNEPYQDDTIDDCSEDMSSFNENTAAIQTRGETTTADQGVNISKPNKKVKIPICGYCGVDCGTTLVYQNHVKHYHPEERIIFCGVCQVTNKGETLHRKHVQEKHGGFDIICKICLELGHAKNYSNHKKQCLGRLLFQCKLCNDYYGKKESLWSHLDGHDIKATSKESSFTECRTKAQFFSCVICEDSKAYEQSAYWRHIEEAHQGHHLRCKYCSKTFRTRGFHSRHTYSDCKARPVPDNQEIKCPECSQVFETRLRLSRHRKDEHSNKPHRCNICGKEFKRFSPFRYHRFTAHTDPKFICPVCQKKFWYPLAFRKHTKIHKENGQLGVEGSTQPVGGHDEFIITELTETFDGTDRTTETVSTEQSEVKTEIDNMDDSDVIVS